MHRRARFASLLACLSFFAFAARPCAEEQNMEAAYASFVDPPMDCRPHTRWWWMGNALRKQDIAWQLEEMAAKGLGGVEQITTGTVYTLAEHISC